MSNNPIEVSLDNLAEVSKKIMEKCINTGELSKADILFLTMYQKEKARATAVPLHKKITNTVKDIVVTIKDILPKTDSKVEKDVYDEEIDSMEVDIDEL